MNGQTLQHLLDFYHLQDVHINIEDPLTTPCVAYGYKQSVKTGHWVAIEETETTVYLFDSFGLKPSQQLYYDIPYWKDLIKGKHVIRNTITIQRVQSIFCGLYAIAYFILRSKHHTFSECIDILSPTVGDNRDNTHRLAEILNVNEELLPSLLR